MPQCQLYGMSHEKLEDLFKRNEESRAVALGCPAANWYLNKRYRPMIIVGPSGVGKSTLINALTAKYPSSFGFSVSYTTRAPRPGEVHGVNYFYITKDEF